MINQSLHVRIVSPQQVILDNYARSVSSKNSQGKFDILPQHANFITVIENQPIIISFPSKNPLTFKFPIAIIISTNNMVYIYTYLLKQDKENHLKN